MYVVCVFCISFVLYSSKALFVKSLIRQKPYSSKAHSKTPLVLFPIPREPSESALY